MSKSMPNNNHFVTKIEISVLKGADQTCTSKTDGKRNSHMPNIPRGVGLGKKKKKGKNK